MKYFFILFLFIGNYTFSQKPEQEIELVKRYKKSLLDKNQSQSIQTLKDLIRYHDDETQYHISLGFIYQLQGYRKLSKNHLQKGREFVKKQLITKVLSPKETMDHVVALCFAGYYSDCEEMFNLVEARLIQDDYYKNYDFDTIKKLGERQREIMKTYFKK